MKFGVFLILSLFGISIGTAKSVKEDCPPGSLDKLKFSDLLEKSKIPDCLNETREVFSKSEYKFNFGSEKALQELNGIIFIGDTKVIKDVLDKFGDLIENIAFTFSNLNNGREMLEYTSEKCSKTLKSITLYDTFGDVLDSLKKPFTNVKKFKFRNSIVIDSSKDIQARMNVSFPALESLELEFLKSYSVVFLQGSFKHLKSIIIRSQWISSSEVHETDFAEFFKINPQIELVDVANANFIFIKVVSDHLPKLKVLKLQTPTIMDYKVDPLHFRDVNEFELRLEKPEEAILDKILFDSKLEKLNLDVVGEASSSKKWFDFITNQNLVEISFRFENLTMEYFSQIPEKQTKLQKVEISNKLDVNATQISNFFEKCADLKHLEVKANMDESNQTELKKKLEGKWKVSFVKLQDQLILIQINPKDPGSDTGAANSLVMSHFTQMLCVIFIMITVKLF